MDFLLKSCIALRKCREDSVVLLPNGVVLCALIITLEVWYYSGCIVDSVDEGYRTDVIRISCWNLATKY